MNTSRHARGPQQQQQQQQRQLQPSKWTSRCMRLFLYLTLDTRVSLIFPQ